MSFESSPTVLVTGAGGFIGSHLAERLVREGCRVRAMVHYNALGSWGWLDQSPLKREMEIVAGDIADRDRVETLTAGASYVFHLAALIAIPYSYSAPMSYVRTNIEGTINVLQAARRYDCLRVLHTSTSEVYGTARTIPIGEDHPLQGQSPYSASKIGADKMAEAFAASFDVPVVTVRPFNTFGPRQSQRAVIPSLICQMLAGGEVRMGSQTPTRDFTYVDDTVNGFVAAALADDRVVGETIHLGTGSEISIGDLARELAALTGQSGQLRTEQERVRPVASEVERLCSNPEKAKRLMGWAPRVELREGLRRTIDWIRVNIDRYRPDSYTV